VARKRRRSDVSLSEAAKLPIDKDDGGDGVSVEDMRPTGHELTCLRVGLVCSRRELVRCRSPSF
jgi:hypothetical protein